MKKIFIILVSGLIFSCQTSKITHTWTADNASPKKFSKVLVLGVMKDNDRDLQFKMENHLAGDLKELGYYAVAANTIFPAGTFVQGDTTRAIAAINSKNFDAVLTIVLLDKVKEKYYVPGRMYYTPFSNDYNQFGRYYFSMEGRIYESGYYTTDTKIFWESNFYDLGTKQMVYSVQTRSFDPGSKESLAHYYGVLISNNLVKKNILVKPLNQDGF